MQYGTFNILVTEDYLCLYQFFEVHASSFGLCFDGTKSHNTCEKLSLLALFRKTRLKIFCSIDDSFIFHAAYLNCSSSFLGPSQFLYEKFIKNFENQVDFLFWSILWVRCFWIKKAVSDISMKNSEKIYVKLHRKLF